MKTKLRNLQFLKPAALMVAAVMLFGLGAVESQGAGLLVADGGLGGVLEVKSHEVDVQINNGIAVTRVTQVFQNMEQRQVEALYTFPVPKGASVANFSMWINGKEMVGEVLEKKRAREIYESYKRVRQDPGLLEQVDYRTFEMRIFPIAPQSDQKVEITYYQELDVDHDWATYVYPLATTTRQQVDSTTRGKFAFNVHAKSLSPMAKVESPSHGSEFVVAKHREDYYQASLESNGGSLAKDVVLAFNLARPQSGMDLVTSQPKGEDGYFALTLTAGDDLKQANAGMDYLFLLDISGSMANDGKLAISRESISAFVSHLRPEDRFELMTFNVQPTLAFRELRPASDENKNAAIAFLRAQSAAGGTVLGPALNAAFKYGVADRPLNVVILSDGLTDQQERATIVQLGRTRPSNARIFCVGVGNDVNRPMLEQVAQDSGGLAAFLSRGDNFERQAQAFQRKLTRPAGTELEISIAGVETYDVEPKKLPNLYHGTPVRVYGRYKKGGEGVVTFKANVNGRPITEQLPLQFKSDANPEIERMWAWHRIDNLLKAADATGNRDAAINEVVRLGEGYSIVTEYTSFLVLENDNEYQRWKIARSNLRRFDADRLAQAHVRKQFDSIRNKALADIGPEAVSVPAPAQKPMQMAQANRNLQPGFDQQPANPGFNRPQTIPDPARRPAPAPQNDQSRSFGGGGGGGGGAVGPIFVGMIALAGWFSRRSTKN